MALNLKKRYKPQDKHLSPDPNINRDFISQMTPTEKKVFDLLYNDCQNAQIAKILLISPHTVKFHVRNILRKSGAKNRYEPITYMKIVKG